MTSLFDYSSTVNQLLTGQSLSYDVTHQAFSALLQGHLTPAQIAGLLVALRAKGETVDEVAAAAHVMRELVTPVQLPESLSLLDLCGTGGDGAHTFNISTACMFVLAAAGVHVAKHGGRSVSSSSGSADVLEALGVNINLKPEQVAQSILRLNVGFMFAPNHHSAMRHAAPVRKELGVRTVFNLLGPLTNPAHAKRQLMGVYSPHLLNLQAQVLARLGSVRALIVHGENGMDELSIEGPSMVAELKNGQITHYTLTPESVGLTRSSHDALHAQTVDESKTKVLQVLQGHKGGATDIVLLNSAAGLYLADQVDSIAEGVAQARSLIESGAALNTLHELVKFTQQASHHE